MARLITGAYVASPSPELSVAERRRGQRRLERASARNPLRRIQLSCETTARRDPSARVGDLVWCDNHRDFARVLSVVE